MSHGLQFWLKKMILVIDEFRYDLYQKTSINCVQVSLHLVVSPLKMTISWLVGATTDMSVTSITL